MKEGRPAGGGVVRYTLLDENGREEEGECVLLLMHHAAGVHTLCTKLFGFSSFTIHTHTSLFVPTAILLHPARSAFERVDIGAANRLNLITTSSKQEPASGAPVLPCHPNEYAEHLQHQALGNLPTAVVYPWPKA